ncbi:MAG: 16S rRNA (cytidine(1402)-2'-O)-methyltransferase [Candidatus Kapaibacterium sp.]|jgi:16S rRNA (cytidine1402-2'-O)-methyltransferase|nr:16S rRNA (cytidine(1402)-2'-O)-methyltransferase [Candidatus Kapabacteria bacterium]
MENTNSTENKGKLYLVSTPIGNKDDITIRAVNTIKRCDIVVCEEMKMGALTLKNLNLAKELIPLNENNESEMTMEVLRLLRSGKKIALISDAGTPVFADPGLYLVKSAIGNDIDIEVVPGASSIMTALVRSGFDIYEFLYAGFLPRKYEDRDRKLQKLSRERRTVVILETPYRLHTLLSACADIMPERKVYLGMNLTMPFETHHYGTFSELVKKFENSKIKSEFVIVMEANKEWIGPKPEISDEVFDDEDDDSPVEYEYPVKAHAKQIQLRKDRKEHKFESKRKPFDKNRTFGEKKSYDGRKSFEGKKSFDGKKSYQGRKSFEGKKSYEDRNSFDGNKPFRRNSDDSFRNRFDSDSTPLPGRGFKRNSKSGGGFGKSKGKSDFRNKRNSD